MVGNTPLVALPRLTERYELKARLLAKLESFNPAGSVKDRVAKAMIETAEREGRLSASSTIVEPTSGNTGIGLAMMGAARGYRVVLTMPDTMSVERQNLLRAYGAEVVLTEGSKGMKGAMAKAEEIASNTPGAFIPSQFSNPANPHAHESTTGPEIWEATDGVIDLFVAGVGTGGTISGAGGYLKRKNPNLRVVAVEPSGSPVLSSGVPGPHRIQGIGAGFIPNTLNTAVYDEVVTIENEDAFTMGKELAEVEGIFAGISSGAAIAAAIQFAKRQEYAGKTIVVVLPDSGDRYLSTPLFSE
ncbi:MAG TPA: cysteine synthase A [Sphaerochaetaceae bacterium]|nr:cysteine synthase A [Sphaerochaetaceae bacterium]